jgi:hypothetical protein
MNEILLLKNFKFTAFGQTSSPFTFNAMPRMTIKLFEIIITSIANRTFFLIETSEAINFGTKWFAGWATITVYILN